MTQEERLISKFNRKEAFILIHSYLYEELSHPLVDDYK